MKTGVRFIAWHGCETLNLSELCLLVVLELRAGFHCTPSVIESRIV